MTAAEITETFQGGNIAGGASYPGTGIVFGIYKATKINTTDWVIFGDFTKVIGCIAINTGLDPITIDSTTTNKCTGSAGTGATTYFVWGTPAKA